MGRRLWRSRARLKEAARRHALTVVFANYAGTTGGLLAAGGSCIRCANREAVARLPADGRGLAIGWDDGSGRWAGKTVLLGAANGAPLA